MITYIIVMLSLATILHAGKFIKAVDNGDNDVASRLFVLASYVLAIVFAANLY